VLGGSLGFALHGVTVLALCVPKPAGAPERPARPAPRRRHGWREVATPGLLRTLGVAAVLGVLTVGDGFIYLTLLDRGGFAARWFPVLYVGTNVAYLSLAVPLGRLADRVGRIRVLVLGHLPLACAYLCAALGSGALAPTVLALLLLGVFYAATDGVLAAVSGRLVPQQVRTTGIAAAQTTVAIARLFASTGFGLLWYAVGPRSAMLDVCVALLAAIPVGLTVLRNTEPLA
jgi:MFS family permease